MVLKKIFFESTGEINRNICNILQVKFDILKIWNKYDRGKRSKDLILAENS